MQTYISILRGINVSGQKKILMKDLKGLYAGLGFKDVTTYIQSGNIIFKADKKYSDWKLSKMIESAIHQKYHFTVPVIIRSIEELEKVLNSNPFFKSASAEIESLYVTFLEDFPEKKHSEETINFPTSHDKFIISGKEIFLYVPSGYGETKLSNSFFEKKLHVTATTRNWKTVNKLAELAKNI